MVEPRDKFKKGQTASAIIPSVVVLIVLIVVVLRPRRVLSPLLILFVINGFVDGSASDGITGRRGTRGKKAWQGGDYGNL